MEEIDLECRALTCLEMMPGDHLAWEDHVVVLLELPRIMTADEVNFVHRAAVILYSADDELPGVPREVGLTSINFPDATRQYHVHRPLQRFTEPAL